MIAECCVLVSLRTGVECEAAEDDDGASEERPVGDVVLRQPARRVDVDAAVAAVLHGGQDVDEHAARTQRHVQPRQTPGHRPQAGL